MGVSLVSIAAAIVACLAASSGALADPVAAFPAKPVRIVIGPSGTFNDSVTRQLAQRLQERWQQPVTVENRASGMIAAATVAKAAPDGYTLLVSDRTWQAVAQNLFKELPYDPTRDFSEVSHVASTPNILVGHPSLPVASIAELIAHARQQTVPLHYATAGIGTATHLPGEQLKQLAGIDLAAVHYKGGGAAMVAILSGEVKLGFNPVLLALPHVRSGKVRAFVVTSSRRFAGAPEIPTVVEAGLPELEADFWIGMFAPARAAGALVARINRDVGAVLESPAMRTSLMEQGAQPVPGTPEAFGSFVRAESRKWGQVIRTAGIKPE